eukprot:6776347-Karenia_brevis.AAC.1
MPDVFTDKSRGGSGLHGPILVTPAGARLLTVPEGMAFFGLPRHLLVDTCYDQAWRDIGKSVPLSMSDLNVAR